MAQTIKTQMTTPACCNHGLCTKRAMRNSSLCKQHHAERRAAQIAQAVAIVSTGKCPECGQPLRRNLALSGWWQCSGFGADGFRATGSTPCSFQTFTE